MNNLSGTDGMTHPTLLLLPLPLQPTVGFGLSNNVLPFFSYLPPTLSIFSFPALGRSLSTSSFHPFLGLPLLLVPFSSWVKFLLGILSSSILPRWPNQLILCPFIHFTIFSPLLISSSTHTCNAARKHRLTSATRVQVCRTEARYCSYEHANIHSQAFLCVISYQINN